MAGVTGCVSRENLMAMAVGFTWTLAGILAMYAVVR
jgi:hypothetical protein